MLIHNMDTQDGLTNGAQGRVEQILSHNKKIRYVMVRFDNENVGQNLRHKLKFLAAVTNIKELTPIERVTVSYTLGKVSKNHAARASFQQIPLKLSWALTAHKVHRIRYVFGVIKTPIFSVSRTDYQTSNQNTS